MTMSAVDTLLREQQATVLRERRAVDRQPFVRPLQITPTRGGDSLFGFSRDVSRNGISIITSEPLTPGTMALLQIHSTFGPQLEIRAQVRWCDSFGAGWFTSGWFFLEGTE